MHVSRRRLLAAGATLPFVAASLNACGGGGGGGSSGGGTASSSSSSSSSSAAVTTFTASATFDVWSGPSQTTRIPLERKVAALTNGNIVMCWETADEGLRAQIFSTTGAKIGAEIVLALAGVAAMESQVASLSGGGFVAIWVQRAAGDLRAHAQIFTSTGAAFAAAFVLDTRPAGHLGFWASGSARVTGLKDGGFAVTWGETGTGQHAQAFAADGTRNGPRLDLEPAYERAIAATTDGGYIVTSMQTGSRTVRLYRMHPPSQTNTTMTVQVPHDIQTQVRVTGLANAGFVLCWFGTGGAVDANNAVYAQFFGPDGEKAGAEVLVNGDTGNLQIMPVIATLANGEVIVSWLHDLGGPSDGPIRYSLKAQLLSATGQKIGTDLFVEDAQAALNMNSIAAHPNGGFVVSWMRYAGSYTANSTLQIKAFQKA